MYLKRLEIQGFKSFADKVEIEFNPGITVVVGPNGSGKSNVVDAIRWVLGEQSAKTLRGMRMDDIIFSGSDGRKAVGLAQVSLTIDNSTGIFPLDFSEVTVTRRLYRSGDSEYLINKVPCRMKDIHELFMDTGVGKEGFSVIGQGKIDEILSLKAEDRRNLIEEAAGIVKYRYRKREAQRKLDDTEQSLVRVYDIISELKDQLGPLEEQANKARQYQVWKEEADQWEISVALYNIEENKGKLQESKEKTLYLEDQLTKDTTKFHSLQSRLEDLRLKAQHLDQEISQLQQNYYNTNRELEKHEHQIEMAKERKSSFISQLARLEDSTKNLTSEEEILREQLHKFSAEVKEVERQHQELTAKIEFLEENFNNHKQTIEEKNDLIEDQKSVLVDFLREIAKTNNEINSLENDLNNFKKSFSQLSQKLLEIQRLITQEEEKLASTTQYSEKLILKKSSLEKEISKLEKSLEDNKEKEQEFKALYEKKSEAYQQLKSHLNVLKEMEASGEGYQKGVKAILEAKKKDSDFAKGIIGTVADIIKVPGELETAIETVMGGSLQYLISENDQVAQRAIEYLKTTKKGRATFLPLNTISYQENNQNLQGDGVLGRASDLVQYDLKYKKIIEFLLGRIWVIKELGQAVALGKKYKFNIRMVTLDGELITPGGALTGGSYSRNTKGLLARKRLISQLIEKVQLAKEELVKLKEDLETIEINQVDIFQNISKLKDQLYNLSLEISQTQGQKEQIQREINRLNTEKEIVSFDQEQLEEQEQFSQKQITMLVNKAYELKEKHSQTELLIQQLETNKKDLALEQEDLLEKLNKEKISIATLEQVKINAKTRYQEIEERLNKLLQEKYNINEEMRVLEDEVLQLESLIIDNQEKVKEFNNSLNNLESLLQDIKAKRTNCTEEIVEVEKEIKEKSALIEEMSLKKHQEELNLAKVKGELDNNTNRLQESFNLTYEEALPRRREIASIKNVKKRINELRSLIEELGLVNFAAINEFSRVSQRLEFLEKQTEDLNEAKSTLSKVIIEMDQIMVKKFNETFEQVNVNFSEVFTQLFEGGKAFLKLTDKEDLLETGIEIIAQPPGKKSQTLSLLSGGERAMTAIALLLAILKVKPSPFCVLDEIEASLDDANVIKFAQYLKRFSQDTQFIMISHRKGTMEIGDFLYGVTMELNGVSKLISVKLSEAI